MSFAVVDGSQSGVDGCAAGESSPQRRAIVLIGAARYGLHGGWGPRPVGVAGPPSPLPTFRNEASDGGCFGHEWSRRLR